MSTETDANPALGAAACSAAGVMFSSASEEWATPQAFFDAQNFIYNFTLDVCASATNAKCARHYTPADDGLKQLWAGERCWMNPPYGRVIGAWMAKAYAESKRGALVVRLIPARTDTAWWHDYAAKGEVTFLRGRLKFLAVDGNPARPATKSVIEGRHAANNSAPFPSALVVFKPQNASPSATGQENKS